MRIGSRQVKGFSALRIVNRLGQALRTRAARHEAVNSPAALRTLSTAMPPAGKHAQPKTGRAEQRDEGATNSRTQGSSLSARALKYAVYLAAGGYAYIEIVNDFPLSTTSLHDGKKGFTSSERLRTAQARAREFHTRYHTGTAETQRLSKRPLNPIRTCGDRQFVTMIDYRAATSVHIARRVDSAEARRSLALNLNCMRGLLVKDDCVARYGPPQVPKDFDLTKSPIYDEKNKYALTGVFNDQTGAYGYTSRSITHPFINKGAQHVWNTLRSEKGLSPKECVEMLEPLLVDETLGLSDQAQFAAGQTILNFRQVYAAEAHWGHAENVVMKTLIEHGLLSKEETEKLEATLMFEDPRKNKLKRNSSLVGPWLHKLDTRLQEVRWGHDPQFVEDLNHREIADMKNLPIAHIKLNEKGDGFEDCSGLGDSFTCANGVACINHARLMSGQPRLSKKEVIVIVACFNAVYDDTSSIRHTLHEIARGCFVGAGYTVEDADAFYRDVCQKAAKEYYGGRNLSDPLQGNSPNASPAEESGLGDNRAPRGSCDPDIRLFAERSRDRTQGLCL
ncbi:MULTISPECIES: XopAG/AvrGf1 family type III secretion system effector [Rhizobium]|uniref:Type III effector HopG1 n=2 Tax=Rhizobium TaxID=379 RepID=A0A6N9ZRA6_9HYPH|nr:MULTISPECIES: XopAG/AvrGf1 family type III secretion system effector [Rhizobium]NEH96013.1 type III effector HopG1 [Rhizobium laguerreae]NEK39682.1 type III effector HopG1 [Rhizobium leguminosarum]NEK46907.1 type III effector HopG1 [Rhizobium leguminosarum]